MEFLMNRGALPIFPRNDVLYIFFIALLYPVPDEEPAEDEKKKSSTIKQSADFPPVTTRYELEALIKETKLVPLNRKAIERLLHLIRFHRWY